MPGRRRTPDTGNLSDTGTSTVANRRAAEAQRQADARAARAEHIKETKAAHKATADRLKAKPTDSRKLVS